MTSFPSSLLRFDADTEARHDSEGLVHVILSTNVSYLLVVLGYAANNPPVITPAGSLYTLRDQDLGDVVTHIGRGYHQATPTIVCVTVRDFGHITWHGTKTFFAHRQITSFRPIPQRYAVHHRGYGLEGSNALWGWRSLHGRSYKCRPHSMGNSHACFR